MDTNKKYWKAVIKYCLSSIFLILFNKVYGLFAHGVASYYMSYMFLITLLGGALFYTVLLSAFPKKIMSTGFKNFSSVYNCSLVTFVLWFMLNGIMEIAGTSSKYLIYYPVIGISLIFISLIIFIKMK